VNISLATVGLLVVSYLINVTQPNLVLQVFYSFVAAYVFFVGFRAKSMLFLFLGTLLFTRFFLENYQYAWSPVAQLGAGHIILAIIAYLLVRKDGDKFLLYFPALIAAQGIADLSHLADPYAYYHHIHNALALMQMSAFMVLARSRRLRPITKEDPIEELISRLTRNWSSALLSWKKRPIS